MEKQLKERIRSVVREGFISELSKNDVHVKEIMKFYDKGTYSTKKAVSIFVSGKTNATRNQILDDLGDMGYNEIWDVMDHFKLKLEYVDKKGVERVAAALPQTEEEPIKECKTCNSK
jgi:RNA:NAD 2'-phosphotransferase (TPT1/KptA family)